MFFYELLTLISMTGNFDGTVLRHVQEHSKTIFNPERVICSNIKVQHGRLFIIFVFVFRGHPVKVKLEIVFLTRRSIQSILALQTVVTICDRIKVKAYLYCTYYTCDE